jgi:hypothetical protein
MEIRESEYIFSLFSSFSDRSSNSGQYPRRIAQNFSRYCFVDLSISRFSFCTLAHQVSVGGFVIVK